LQCSSRLPFCFSEVVSRNGMHERMGVGLRA
jgi:hypothetical protein